MCRMRSHSPTATTTALMKTTSWLESNGMSPGSFQSTFGLGPDGGRQPHLGDVATPRDDEPDGVHELVVEPRGEGRDRDEQADRRHDLGRLGRPGEGPEHARVEQEAEQRREHQDHEHGGGHDRPVEPGVELVVEERARERDRAVREVEDAGRAVRQHEAGRDEREDGAGDGAAHGQGQELLHDLTFRTFRRSANADGTDRRFAGTADPSSAGTGAATSSPGSGST